MTSKRTETLIVRMTPELKKLLSKAAKKDSRSMSSLIEKLVKDYLSNEGIEFLND